MADFGTMPSGETVERVHLDNGHLAVDVLTYGAVLQTIHVPDRAGTRANVALGFATLAEYLAKGGHLGAVPGRYAGRIAYGRFTLDGEAHQLTVNRPPHTLHGGAVGFGKRNWTLASSDAHHCELHLHSVDGDEGFPGAMDVRVRYTLDRADLRIDYHATTDRPTIVNLTNHSYFNLSGEGAGDILGHTLEVVSDSILPIAPDGIPTGETMPVDGTPFDFRQPRVVASRIRDAHPQILCGLGYDHAYNLTGEGLRHAATLTEAVSGRSLTVLTTEPVLHLYTGNNLPGSFAGPTGRVYRPGDGICFEAEHPQDAPNHPAFPSTTLRPGQTFAATTIFRFGVVP